MDNCDYKKDSNNPCKDCPRLISALYMCSLLKEVANNQKPTSKSQQPTATK